MHRETLKDLSQDQILEAMDALLLRAFAFFVPGRHEAGLENTLGQRRDAALTAAGIDPRMLDVRAYDGLAYRHEYAIAFGLRVSVEIEIDWHNGVEPKVRISWSSGGSQDVSEAVACASLYLETAQRAARAQAAIWEGLRPLRGTGSADHEAWDRACTAWRCRVEERAPAARAVLDAAGLI